MSALRKGFLAGLLAPLAVGCLASPPGNLPSSVRILYSRASKDSLGSSVDIYFLVARARNELQLTGEEAIERQPTFAPRLRKVFFTREVEGRQEIWSMDLDGSAEGAVLSAPGENFRDPALSPNETQLAFTHVIGGQTQVEIGGIDGSDRRVLIAEGGAWSQPAWSPDGRSLVVAGEDAASPRLFVVGAQGGAPRPLAPAATGVQTEPNWSPDGQRVVFTLGSGSGAEIAVAEVAGGAVTTLTDNDSEDSSPAYSPSSERIIFVSRRPHDRYNLWLMDADGSDVEALTRNEEADARDPNWL